MLLSGMAFPVDIETCRRHALVFSPALASRLAEIHAEHGSQNCVPVPIRLTDGRLMLSADILTEIGPGGLLESMWQNCDQQAVMDGVDVLPMGEVIALMPSAPLRD